MLIYSQGVVRAALRPDFNTAAAPLCDTTSSTCIAWLFKSWLTQSGASACTANVAGAHTGQVPESRPKPHSLMPCTPIPFRNVSAAARGASELYAVVP